jgi:ABC-type molybdenum transport system ATPase subunit/photorepair protein PhrA
MLIKFKQLDVQPGQRILLKDVSWQQFEDILE